MDIFVSYAACSTAQTLAVRGLEEPWNFQESFTESVGPVHFSDVSCLFINI